MIIERTAEELIVETPTLFHDRDGTGYAYRCWAMDLWTEHYGHFDSIRASHGWRPPFSTTGYVRDQEYCQAEVLNASLDCDHYDDPCFCVGGRVHRGACSWCDWEGPTRTNETQAIEDAHDHAWPGWRDLPVLPRWPDEGTGKKKGVDRAHWWATARELYPEGWIEQGGPILTRRGVMGTHPIRGHFHPAGGWDICGAQDTTDCALSRGQTKCPGLDGCISEHWTCTPWVKGEYDDGDD